MRVDLTIPDFLRRDRPTRQEITDQVHSLIADEPRGICIGGLRWMRIYWFAGNVRKTYGPHVPANEVRDPPSSGWGMALVLGEMSASHFIIFVPRTLQSYRVSAGSYEMAHAIDCSAEARPQYIVNTILDRWDKPWSEATPNLDRSTAAKVLELLGAAVPTAPTPSPVRDEGAAERARRSREQRKVTDPGFVRKERARKWASARERRAQTTEA